MMLHWPISSVEFVEGTQQHPGDTAGQSVCTSYIYVASTLMQVWWLRASAMPGTPTVNSIWSSVSGQEAQKCVTEMLGLVRLCCFVQANSACISSMAWQGYYLGFRVYLYLDASVEDDTLKKVVLHSVATALASMVLPVPGGPNISTPCIPIALISLLSTNLLH